MNLNDHFPLRTKRTHEVMGPGSVFFAFALAATQTGPILWVEEDWQEEAINPWGIADFIDPARLLVAKTQSQTETLAVAEDALRAGAVDLVMYRLTTSYSLTAGRRLQLAADAGKSMGLGLIQDGMGNNATETRWHVTPEFDGPEFNGPENDRADSTLQKWELKKNKKGTLGIWHVRWNTSSRSVIVVPPAGDRPGSTKMPD